MNDKMKICSRLKAEYYVKIIKMLYNWSNIQERNIVEYVTALGLFEYTESLEWLLAHKSTLNAAININLSELPNNSRGTLEYNKILDRLKVALVVCNKTQAVKILSSVAHYSSNPKDDINYLGTF